MSVIVHPLALLTIIDEFQRRGRNNDSIIFGGLLGKHDESTNQISVVNSFVIPLIDNQFLNKEYLQDMLLKFSIINSNFRFVGYYHVQSLNGTETQQYDLNAINLVCQDDNRPSSFVHWIVTDPKEFKSFSMYYLDDSMVQLVNSNIQHYISKPLPYEFKNLLSEKIAIDTIIKQSRLEKDLSTKNSLKKLNNSYIDIHSSLNVLYKSVNRLIRYLKKCSKSEVSIDYDTVQEINTVILKIERLKLIPQVKEEFDLVTLSLLVDNLDQMDHLLYLRKQVAQYKISESMYS
ncbi:hypothetical protein LJB42_002777 [Komagataella kurtzmanii]|nr:hypothetical protein LJB42_002777 [Komagataella kurtzmanii]